MISTLFKSAVALISSLCAAAAPPVRAVASCTQSPEWPHAKELAQQTSDWQSRRSRPDVRMHFIPIRDS
eukprot:6190212-Pleurochrysis_carterae.AAC.1